MIRKTLAVALCVFLLTSVGVGVVAAVPQKLPPSYRVLQFNVTHNDEIVGKLSVNTNQWTYGLNAHGLQPGMKYYFYGHRDLISNGTANEYGDLHIQGTMPSNVNIIETPLSTPTSFVVSDRRLPGSYCVMPQLTSGCFNGMIYSVFWGTLMNSSGTPLRYQTLEIDAWDKKEGAFLRWGDYLETGADGRFKVTRAGTATEAPMVIYDGGSYDGIPYCHTWVLCTVSNKIPL